jgi:hypothetical protein
LDQEEAGGAKGGGRGEEGTRKGGEGEGGPFPWCLKQARTCYWP